MKRKNVRGMSIVLVVVSCLTRISLSAQTESQLSEYDSAMATLENFNRIQREAGMPEMEITSFSDWTQSREQQAFQMNRSLLPKETAEERWNRRLAEVQPYLCQLLPRDSKYAGSNFATSIHSENENLKQLAMNAQMRRDNVEWELDAIAEKYGVPRVWEDGTGGSMMLSGEQKGRPVWIGDSGLLSAMGIGADKLWPSNLAGWGIESLNLDLTGAGITLGMWEQFSLSTTNHQEFGSRIIQKDGVNWPSPSFGNHATSIAGTMSSGGENVFLPQMGGYGDWARGVAYDANVDAYNLDSFESEILAASAESEGNPGLRISNHSWEIEPSWQRIHIGTYWYNLEQRYLGEVAWVWFGGIHDAADYVCGQYLEDQANGTGCSQIDTFMSTQAPRHLMVTAAGNARFTGPQVPSVYYIYDYATGTFERPVGSPQPSERDWATGDDDFYGFDSVLPPGTAKNVLTVGGIQDIYSVSNNYPVLGFGENADWDLYYYSGCGPTDDGRIKPDVMAVGQANPYLRSTFGIVGPTSVPPPAPLDFSCIRLRR